MTRLVNVKKGYFDFSWGQLHYRSANLDSDLPLLIMLHQSPLSSRNYEVILPFLGTNCRVLAIDTPGFGQSDTPTLTWNAHDYAKIPTRCADYLNTDQFYLFGRATGAVFGFIAAMLFPSRIKKLILHGMPVYTVEERKDRLTAFAPPYEITEEGTHFEWIWKRVHSEYPWIDPELATHLSKDFLNAGSDFAASYRAIWHYDLPAAYAEANSKMPCPTMLIGGGKDRISFMHSRATALIRDASNCFIPGATDFIAEQDPDHFAQTLISFLNK